MKAQIFGVIIAALATPAFAGGNHAGGHGEAMAVGEPGKKADATQTIRVTMKETEDGKMIFTPSTFKVRKGSASRSRTRANSNTSSCSIRKTRSWSTRR